MSISRSSRVDEQMAVLVASLQALRSDVRAVRLAIETGVAAHARHVARGKATGKSEQTNGD